MRARLSVVALLLVSALIAGAGSALAQDGPASGPSAAETTPTCNGVPATDYLTTPGTLNGTPGDDVLVGSSGNDVINGLDGNDLICGSTTFACSIGPSFGGNDKLYGGTGNDTLLDNCGPEPPANEGDGGSGNDILRIKGKAVGGSGNDSQVRSMGGTADGGSGNDTVEGQGATLLLGGSGSDEVDNDGGTPKIDCGSAVDTVDRDGATDVRRCEVNQDLDPQP